MVDRKSNYNVSLLVVCSLIHLCSPPSFFLLLLNALWNGLRKYFYFYGLLSISVLFALQNDKNVV